ncbi:sensor histidine kinase KdpD [Listeria aquatica]|uniref:sensor histidine kinase KdpD n=1 Tax=Listeria aquatica TaxID=1494960 RepID=UPI0031455143
MEPVNRDEQNKKRGKLKIYFGYAAGVGKTYAMLSDAREELARGVDIRIGYLEPHMRKETAELAAGLPQIPLKSIRYREIDLTELDLDGILDAHPDVVLVDELAHTNPAGMRNRKRYQDVSELLDAGISVYTTVNVQHIESLNDLVSSMMESDLAETIPDWFFDQADQIRLIDVEPDELIKRLEEGKIYSSDSIQVALSHFFTKSNLRVLREMATRKAADRISSSNQKEARTSNTNWLVCVDTSLSAKKLIRWTARAAEAFHGTFTALHVSSGKPLSKDETERLRENMELAEELSAETVTITGSELATAISEYAKLSGVTNIVIGKSKKHNWIFGEDLEDTLFHLLDKTEIHMVKTAPEKAKRRLRFSLRDTISWNDTFKMLVALILATLVSEVLLHLGIGDQNIIMVYILAIVILSRITTGYLYGIIGSFFAVLMFNFFFMDPLYTFDTIQAGYPITYGIMLIVALTTSALTVRIKNFAKQAVIREKHTEILYELNRKLLAAQNLQAILELSTNYMLRLFARSVVFYPKDPEKESSAVFLQAEDETKSEVLLSKAEQAVVHWVFHNGKAAGKTTDTLSGAAGYYMPVIAQGQVLGVVGLYASREKELISQEERNFLRMIGSQIALALLKQKLSDEQNEILVVAEKEKMRGNLLRAVSHDLRTPLTGILGASSVLLESEVKLDHDTKTKLVRDIKEDSEWLIRMIENLLSVTRISDKEFALKPENEAIEEIIGEAVQRVRARFPGREIAVQVPNEVVFAPMDGTLIEQVLINLMENALRHGGANARIWVTAKLAQNEVQFTVKDDGTGIPREKMSHLFDGISALETSRVDQSRGLGIGLSLCMSIIKAHGGKMEALENPGGGTIFRFTLPLGGNEDGN